MSERLTLAELMNEVKTKLDEIQVVVAGFDDEEKEEEFHMLNADYGEIKNDLTILEENSDLVSDDDEERYRYRLEYLLEEAETFLDSIDD